MVSASSRKRKALSHAADRALERYGSELGPNDILAISAKIKKNRLRYTSEICFVKTVSNSRTVWDVKYNGKVYRALYDKDRHIIRTILPRKPSPDWLIDQT